jgi:predicted nucleotidyltransferase
MTREEVIERLRPHEAELREAGVAALYLFGSVARDEADRASDVDVAFDLGNAPGFSLLSQADLQCRLEDWLDRQVDFVCRTDMRPSVRRRVERDMVQVF